MSSELIPVVGAFLVVIPAFAFGARLVVNAIADAVLRVRQAPGRDGALAPGSRIAELEAEVEALRGEVERLAAAESFYARLNAPADTQAR